MTRYPRIALFLEGSVSVSLQFLFIRHLMPEVGSSILVTTITVSLFLLALSLGYLSGGRHQSSIQRRFGWNCLKAAVIISIGLSPLTSTLFFNAFTKVDELILLGVYCLLFMAPAVYWLGQTMPLLSNEIKARSNGELSSSVLFFSTLGNVIGGLISILVLTKLFGMGITVFINILVLVSLYAACTPSRLERTIFLSASLAIAYPLTVMAEMASYDKTSAYGNYKIREYSDRTIFFGNNLAHSIIDKEGKSAEYIHMAEKIVNQNINDTSEILILGAGGFSFGRHLPAHKITFVDIDSSIKPLAEERFIRQPVNGQFVEMDARIYLKKHNKKYDFIILDTFQSTNAIAGHLVTQEYFDLVKSRVNDKGRVIINTIASKNFEDTYSRDLHTTIMSVFPYCSVNTLNTYGSKVANRLYDCVNVISEPHIIRDRKVEY